MGLFHSAYYLFILYLVFVKCDDEEDCKIKKSHLPLHRLKNDLLCDYEKSLRPKIDHGNFTTVNMKMVLKSLSYDMHIHEISVNSWLALSWRDDHLKWTPSDYEGIEKLHLSSDDIWVPDLSLYNRADQGTTHTVMSSVDCLVYKTGLVVCIPPGKHTGLCIPNLEKYPFDVQNCTLRFGSWVFSGEEMNIVVNDKSISKGDFTENPEYALINATITKHDGKFKCCPNNTFPSINIHFMLKRTASSVAAVYIIPAIVLIFVTLIGFVLDINSSDRLILACVNLMLHFTYIQSVWWNLPNGGIKIPLLILYSRDSLILTTFSIVMTLILRSSNGTKNTPVWITSVITSITTSKPGLFIFSFDSNIQNLKASQKDEETEGIVENISKGSREWMIFTKIIDRLCLLIYFVIYSIMIVAFLP